MSVSPFQCFVCQPVTSKPPNRVSKRNLLSSEFKVQTILQHSANSKKLRISRMPDKSDYSRKCSAPSRNSAFASPSVPIGVNGNGSTDENLYGGLNRGNLYPSAP